MSSSLDIESICCCVTASSAEGFSSCIVLPPTLYPALPPSAKFWSSVVKLSAAPKKNSSYFLYASFNKAGSESPLYLGVLPSGIISFFNSAMIENNTLLEKSLFSIKDLPTASSLVKNVSLAFFSFICCATSSPFFCLSSSATISFIVFSMLFAISNLAYVLPCEPPAASAAMSMFPCNNVLNKSASAADLPILSASKSSNKFFTGSLAAVAAVDKKPPLGGVDIRFKPKSIKNLLKPSPSGLWK